MTRYLYCSIRLPFRCIASIKARVLEKMAKKKKLNCRKIIFDWYQAEKDHRDGLYQLYRRAYQGKVDGIMIYSLKDIGNFDEQVEFLERMQELEIPVFCLKENRYLKVEVE